jgi:hypothetical protein
VGDGIHDGVRCEEASGVSGVVKMLCYVLHSSLRKAANREPTSSAVPLSSIVEASGAGSWSGHSEKNTKVHSAQNPNSAGKIQKYTLNQSEKHTTRAHSKRVTVGFNSELAADRS